jgi:hypothetical protein
MGGDLTDGDDQLGGSLREMKGQTRFFRIGIY